MTSSKSESQIHNARLLIVDDNPDMVGVLEAMLKMAGYHNILSTTESYRALALYSEFQPDLILLDLMMPDWDGFQVMAQLKTLTPDEMYLPILVLTGHGTVESKERALREGAKDFLTKPFDVTEVLLRIRNLLEARFLHLHLQHQNRALAEKMNEVMRHQAEAQEALEALRESEERFRATFEQAAVGIAHVAPDGRLLRVNGRFGEIVGYTREELQERTFQDLTHPDDLEADLEFVRQMLSGERQVYAMEKRYLRKDGGTVWANLTVSLVREDAAQPRDFPKYFISVVEDISLRKAAEESKRLYAQRLANLVEIDQAILSAGSPPEIVSSTLNQLQQQLAFPYINIRLLDRETCQRTQPLVAPHNGSRFRKDVEKGTDEAKIYTEALDVVKDVTTLDRSNPLYAELIQWNLSACIEIPLISRNKLIGCLELAAENSCAFTCDDLEIGREVADRLAVALQDAQLYEQVRVANEQLQALSERLVEAQEAERRHLAHELHAEIGQALTVIHINLHGMKARPGVNVELIEENISLVERTLHQVRELSRSLRPAMLDEMGLCAALQVYVKNQAKRLDLTPNFKGDDHLARHLPPRVEIACFRIAQEALTNIMRHARATELWVSLQEVDGHLQLCICDDGIGFDVRAARERAANGTSMGLLAMEERTRLAGGRLEISSKPVASPAATTGGDLPPIHGTRITVLFPLQPSNAATLADDKLSEAQNTPR